MEKDVSPAGHSKFRILQRSFASGPAATEACLACHTGVADQVMHSIHFRGDFCRVDTGQHLGKRHIATC